MYGALIGDIVGSRYEFNNIKTKEFPLFSEYSDITDDSIMSIAVAKAIIRSYLEKGDFESLVIEEMQSFGREIPYPKGGYGFNFSIWLRNDNPKPYGSYGNGSAMRVSACGIVATDIEEAKNLARISAGVTHNHPEGIKGAEAVSVAVFMAKSGYSKDEIGEYIKQNYYVLNKSLDEIRDEYSFNESCQGTVPEAIIAFLESESFEDAIRNAISIGGDSDTIGAITGSIAWSYYLNKSNPEDMISIKQEAIKHYIPDNFIEIIDELYKVRDEKKLKNL